MSETAANRRWIAYGPAGVVGTVEKSGPDRYAVRMAGRDEVLGPYPSMDVAKNALHSRLPPGADWPQFRER